MKKADKKYSDSVAQISGGGNLILKKN